MLKIFSTFSGIGGFEVGALNALGKDNIEVVGYSEIDKYAIQVYTHNFPNHKNYGDITTIDTDTLPDFDVLVGGAPCQAFSISGKRLGFNDTRGTMFYQFARMLKAKQPRYFIFENVKGLFSHDSGKSFRVIISTFAELGYDVQWDLHNSKNYGVSQNRERVYIVGCLRGTGLRKILPIRSDNTEAIKELTTRTPVSFVKEQRNEEGKEIRRNNKKLFGIDSNPFRAKETVIVPQTFSNTLTTVQKDNYFIDLSYQEAKITPIARTIQARYMKGVTNRAAELSGVIHAGAIRGRYNEDNEIEQELELRADGLTNTLTSVQKDNVLVSDKLDIISFEQRRTQSKISVISPTLTASYYKGVEGDGKPAVIRHSNLRIRRLTPTECEALQAFPNNWTALGIDDKGNQVAISDSQRYKMCGNAITTNVAEYIFNQIFNN